MTLSMRLHKSWSTAGCKLQSSSTVWRTKDAHTAMLDWQAWPHHARNDQLHEA